MGLITTAISKCRSRDPVGTVMINRVMKSRFVFAWFFVLTLFSLTGFTQVADSKCASLVSNTFDGRQYLNSDDGARIGRALEAPDPKYPWTAQRRGIQGTIVLAVAINNKGEIDKVKIVRRLDPDLDQAAVDAVKQWHFAPAEKDGEAVPFQTLVEVSFARY